MPPQWRTRKDFVIKNEPIELGLSNDVSNFVTIRLLIYYKFFSSYSLGQRVYHETKFSVLTVFLGGLLLKKTAAVYMFSLYPLLKLSEREKRKF